MLMCAACRSSRTIIFCNKIETCRVVENALRRRRGDDACQVGWHPSYCNLALHLNPGVVSKCDSSSHMDHAVYMSTL